MRKVIYRAMTFLTVLLTFSIRAPQMLPTTLAVGSTWLSTTPLPNPSAAHHCAVHDNKMYVVGGQTPTSGIRYDRVLYASIQPDGHIEDPPGWQENPAHLPEERTNAPVVVYEDWIYVLDGSANQYNSHIERDTVWFASFNPDGSIGSWTGTTSLPYRGCEEAVQWNGRIYILAGWDGYNEHDDVYFAEIDPVNGQLGPWNPTAHLPREYAHEHAAVVHNGVIYFIGGNEAYPLYHAHEVYYGIIDEESGEVEEWIETAPLPVPLGGHDAVVCGDDLFVIGGRADGGPISDAVYKAHINPNGSLDSWEECCCVLPEPLTHVGSVVLNSRIYVIGGERQDNTLVDTVYFTEIVPLPVIPEVPLGTIMASAAMIVALVAYVALPRWRRKPI